MGRPVVHWELWSKDPERLSEFHTAVFGWKIQHIPAMSYRLADTGSGRGIGGGIMRPQEGPWPGNMTMYVDVEDLEGYTWYFGGYRPGEHWQR
jgi:predicted enzyme related to lactoylglutathione lyase